MIWLRVFGDLCIFVYVILQCVKSTYLSSDGESMPAVLESSARVSLIVNPILFLLLFLHEPQTVLVLFVLIFLQMLLATDWILTYMSLSNADIDGPLPSFVKLGYMGYLILKVLTVVTTLGS